MGRLVLLWRLRESDTDGPRKNWKKIVKVEVLLKSSFSRPKNKDSHEKLLFKAKSNCKRYFLKVLKRCCWERQFITLLVLVYTGTVLSNGAVQFGAVSTESMP